jgi:uncharacterized repeat protein (TIGR01451 family)
MARRHSVLLAGALVLTGSLAATLPADAADNALFAPYVAYDPGGEAASVAIGDVTGDRLDDVVLTTDRADDPTHAYSVWVYPQRADGSLGDPLQTQTTGGPGSPMAVALADLDGDGDLDAAVTTDAGVEVLKQVDGRLEYEWPAWAEGGTDLELEDVNGDDLPDLVVNTPGGVVVMWQIFGDLMSARPDRLVTTYPVTEVEVGDVTGDGLSDLVTALGRTVEVRAQLPDHSFAAPVSYLSGGVSGWETVEGLALGDTNGDGRLDVHVSGGGNSPSSWVTSLVQLADGTLAKPARYASYDLPSTLESDDVTGDGRADLVVLHDSWNALGVYDSTPGTMPVETRFPIPHGQGYSADALAIGDVSGDGRADVAIADPQNGLVLLRGAPAGSDVYPPETTLVSGPSGTIYTRTATFTMSASEPANFQCSLDGSAWSPCGSSKTYQGLTAGDHSFEARAVDHSGNVDQTPVWRPFTVDGPATSIDSGPTGSIRSTTASFTFSAYPAAAAASFDCSLDATSWSPCTSPITYTDLTTGSDHYFQVRAVSSDGLADSTPAQRLFTVDPETDLAVTMTGAPNPVKKGGSLTWTAEVRNLGPAKATGLVLDQALPAGATLVTVTPAVTTSSPTSCRPSAEGVLCTLDTLLSGSVWRVTVTTTVTAAKGSLTSSAGLRSATWDREGANDVASATVKVGNGR